MKITKIIFGVLFVSVVCACGLKTMGELPADGSSGCDPGQTLCENSCFDTQTERLHCGSCGNECTDPLALCVSGACRCADSFIECDGQCVAPLIDKNHCGGCGHKCDTMATCTSGECQCASASGFTDCDGKCVNTDTDKLNCGRCGNVCGTNQVCNGSGVCTTECDSGITTCDPGLDPYCADTLSDPLNCGGCHNGCGPYDHATPLCTTGICNRVCDTGYGDANGIIDDGCECPITNGGIEACDAIDNDCNGAPDDGAGFACFLGQSDQNCNDSETGCAGWQQCEAQGPVCGWNTCSNIAWRCSPGDIEIQDCGDGSCGTQSQSCGWDCAWSGYGSCELNTAAGKICWENATEGCGYCGSRTCTNCQWGGCGGEGPCYSGQVDYTCNPSGTTCSGTRTCSVICRWGTCTETCIGTTPDCCTNGCTNLNSDDHHCGSCPNDCGTGHCCSGNCRQCCNNGHCGGGTPYCCSDGTCRECCNNGHCNDNNPCTTDTCNGDGTCSRTPVSDMTLCAGGRCCSGQCRTGANCCAASDCSCTGTVRACGFVPVSQCASQTGCSPVAASCSGTPANCTSHGSNSSCTACGCDWAGSCTGSSPTACPLLPEADCTTCGCTWNTASCVGIHDICGSYSQSNCAGQLDCRWQACTGYQCI